MPVKKFLRQFHREVFCIKNRILALVWYLKKNEVSLFCLLYILFNFLSLRCLRNNFKWLIMGLVISTILLITVLGLRYLVRKKPYETDVKDIKKKETEYSLLTILNLFLVIVLAISFCFIRLYPFLKDENSSILKVESFTGIYECFELEVNRDPGIGSKKTSYYMTILSDYSGNRSVSGVGVLVQLPNFPRIGVGDVCKICGTISEPENFDDFDYKKFLMNKGVYGILESGSADCSLEKHRSLKSVLYDIKKTLIQKLEKNMVEPQVSLLAGIIFGENRVFSEKFEQYLRNSGTNHIVAASGYNVTILILMVNKLFKFLNKKYKDILSLLVIWLFCIMSGMSASIIRASIMGSFTLLSSFLGRYHSIHRTFVMGIWLFVFISPAVVFDIGFQLSVAATLGLIYLSPSIKDFLKKKRIKNSEFFEEHMLSTISCTLFTLPVLVLNFGTFTCIGIFANVLILPVLESTMLWGVLGLLFSFISNSISKIFFAVSFVQLKYFEIVVTKLGNLDFLTFELNGNRKMIISIIVTVILFFFVIKEYPVENESFNYYFRLARGEDD